MYTGSGQISQTREVQKARCGFSQVLHHQALLKITIHAVENNASSVQKAKVRKSYVEYMEITVKRLNGKCSCKSYIQINGKFMGGFTT